MLIRDICYSSPNYLGFRDYINIKVSVSKFCWFQIPYRDTLLSMG